MKCFRTDDRVSVLWAETGCRFDGTVLSVHDNSIDVLYDDTVDGKKCIERNITIDRVYPFDDRDDTNVKEKFLKKLNILDFLEKIEEDMDADCDPSSLSNEQVRELHQFLTLSRIEEALLKSPSVVHNLARILAAKINATSTDITPHFENEFMKYIDVEYGRSAYSWFNEVDDDLSEIPSGRRKLAAFVESLMETDLLLRLIIQDDAHQASRSAYSSDTATSGVSVMDVASIVDSELLERSLSLLRHFLLSNSFIPGAGVVAEVKAEPSRRPSSLNDSSINVVAPAPEPKRRLPKRAATSLAKDDQSDDSDDEDFEKPSGRIKASSRGGGTAAGGKAKSATVSSKLFKAEVKKAMLEVCREVIPVVNSITFLLPSLLNTHRRRQSDRVVVAALELAMAILRVEGSGTTTAALFDESRRTLPLASAGSKKGLVGQSSLAYIDHGIGGADGSGPPSPSHMLSMHALLLTRLISQQYPSHRLSILQDTLPLLSQVYGGKTISKTFGLHAHGSGSVGKASQCVSMTFAMLLMVLQAAFDDTESMTAASSLASQARAVQSPLPFETATAAATSSADEGDKEKPRKVTRGSVAKEAAPIMSTPSSIDKKGTSVPTIQATLKEGPDATDRITASFQRVKRLCLVFINDLLKRCVLKDMNAEYRTVANCLLHEALSAISCPHFPVCVTFLEVFLHRLVTDMEQACMNQDVLTADLRKDPSYVTFCMDLVAIAAARLRLPLLAVEKEEASRAVAKLEPALKAAVSPPVLSLSRRWSAQLFSWSLLSGGESSSGDNQKGNAKVSEKEAPEAEMRSGSRKRSSSGPALATDSVNKKPRKSPSQVDEEKNTEENVGGAISATQHAALVSAAFSIFAEVTAVTVKALASTDLTSMSSAEVEDNYIGRASASTAVIGVKIETTSSPIAVGTQEISEDSLLFAAVSEDVNIDDQLKGLSLPTPTAIMAECNVDQKLLGSLPCIPTTMQGYYLVVEHLGKIVSISAPTHDASLRGSRQEDIKRVILGAAAHIHDAHQLVQGMWLQDVQKLAVTYAEDKKVPSSEYMSDETKTSLMRLVSARIKGIGASLSSSLTLGQRNLVGTLSASSTSRLSTSVDEDEQSEAFDLLLSYDWVRATYRRVIVDRFIRLYFNRILSSLLVMFSVGLTAIRARVIKSLSLLLQSDRDLIKRDDVREAITERFNDVAISVREEAVKLVGFFMTRGGRSADGYLDGLIVRLRDRGVSVRKTVVCILRDMLLCQPDHPRYSELCLHLLGRGSMPKEEVTIKDTIRSTFQQVWFLPASSSVIEASAAVRQKNRQSLISLTAAAAAEECAVSAAARSSSGDGSPSSRPPSHGTPKQAGSGSKAASAAIVGGQDEQQAWHVQSTAMQILDVLAACRGGSSGGGGLLVAIGGGPGALETETMQWMVLLIREMLHGNTLPTDALREKDKVAARKAASLLQCTRLVRAIFDILLRTEESDASVMQALAVRERSANEHVVVSMNALSVFCEAHPPLLVPHLSALVPYLKPHALLNPEQQGSVCLRVTQILSAVSVVQEVKLGARASEICADLTSMALRYGPANVSAAVECMAQIAAHITRDVSPIVSLAEKCFYAISGIARTADPTSSLMSPQQLARIQRSLVVLGAVCENAKKCANLLISSSTTSSPSSRQTAFNLRDDDSQDPGDSRGGGLNASIAPYADIFSVQRVSGDRLNEATFAAALYTLSLPDEVTQARAVQALCSVFTGCPRLILYSETVRVQTSLFGSDSVGSPSRGSDKIGLLSTLFGSDFSDYVHCRLLVGLKVMIEAEEARLEAGAAVVQLERSGVSIGKTVLGPSEHESDATVAGFVLQKHFPSLVGFLTRAPGGSNNNRGHVSEGMEAQAKAAASLRLAALGLLGTLLRQGMICPLDIIGHLVALQGDITTEIKDEALRLLQIEDERHPAFLDNRVLQGIEQTFDLQRKILGVENPVDAGGECSDQLKMQPQSIFRSLYASCVQQSSNKRRRTDFLLGLLKRTAALATELRAAVSPAIGGRVTPTTPRPPLLSTAAVGVAKATFLLKALAYLPLSVAEEPLHIIYWIGRNVPTQATILLADMRTTLLALGSEGGRQAGGVFAAADFGVQSRNFSEMQPPPVGAQPRKGIKYHATDMGISSSSKPSYTSDWTDGLIFDEQRFAGAFASCVSSQVVAMDAFSAKLAELSALGAAARCLEGLLNLKFFLKAAYNLSNERCALFSPDERGNAIGSAATATANGVGATASGNASAMSSSAADNRIKALSESSSVHEYSFVPDSVLPFPDVMALFSYLRRLPTTESDAAPPSSTHASSEAATTASRVVPRRATRTNDHTTTASSSSAAVEDAAAGCCADILRAAVADYNRLLAFLDGDGSSSADFTLAPAKAKGTKRTRLNKD